MQRSLLLMLLMLTPATACDRAQATPLTSGTPATTASAARATLAAHATGLGEVMVGVGRRFEVAGRAANANRFELAEFEVGEIEEAFEDDVPSADLPKEGPTAHIPMMAKAFLKTTIPQLKAAAASKNAATFRESFGRTAAVCNACHQASAKGFILIPSVPGHSVPELELETAPTP